MTTDATDYRADGRKLMDLMLLAADHGSTITVEVTGPDEEEALTALAALIECGFEKMPPAAENR